MNKNQLVNKKKVYYISLIATFTLLFIFGLIFFHASDYYREGFFKKHHDLHEKPLILDNDFFLYYFRIANQAYLEGRLDEAIENISKVADVKLSAHQSYKFYILMACIFRDKNDYEKSLENTNRAIEMNPTAFSFFLKANILDKLGKQDEMIVSLKESIKLNSSFRMAYEKLGDHFFNQEDFLQARSYYQKVDKTGMPIASVRIKLALVDYYGGLYGEAIKKLESLGSIEKSHYISFIYFLIGMNQFSIKNFDECNKNFTKAISSATALEKVFYLYYWAKLSNLRNEFQRSISLLQRGLAIADANHPFFLNLLKDLSYVSFYLGEYVQGLSYLKKLNKYSPEVLDDTLRYHLAVFYYKNNELELSKKHFQWIFEKSKSQEFQKSATYLLAQIFYQQKDFVKSKEMLMKFSKSWGNTPLIVYALMKLEIVKSNDSFLELYRKYSKKNSEKKYDLLLAKHFVDIKDYSSAIAIYSDYVKKRPSAKSFLLLGDLYQYIKEYDLSLYYYDRAWENTSSSIKKEQILNNKSRVLIQEGRFEDAKVILNSLVKTSKNPVIYWYNLALLFLSKDDKKNYKEMLRKAYLNITGEESKKVRALINFHYALIKARAYNFKLARNLIEKAYRLDSTNEKISYYRNKGFKSIFHF